MHNAAPQFTLAPALQSIVTPGVLWWSGATVVAREPRLDPLLAEAEATVRVTPPAESAAVRTMYKRVGIDPTKTRPSNEALLRRVRKGDTIPRINSLVDIVNWCSLEFQLPYGLYDLSKTSGPVTMRLGAEGESYPGIRKDVVNVTGRITVADSLGPFGNPSSDSARTMVTPATTEALVIVYAPAAITRQQIARVLDVTAGRLVLIAGGREVARSLPAAVATVERRDRSPHVRLPRCPENHAPVPARRRGRLRRRSCRGQCVPRNFFTIVRHEEWQFLPGMDAGISRLPLARVWHGIGSRSPHAVTGYAICHLSPGPKAT